MQQFQLQDQAPNGPSSVMALKLAMPRCASNKHGTFCTSRQQNLELCFSPGSLGSVFGSVVAAACIEVGALEVCRLSVGSQKDWNWAACKR